MKPSDIRSMCCRLRLDLRELRKKAAAFSAQERSTGSVGVVTINMPRIAYQSRNPEEFLPQTGPYDGHCGKISAYQETGDLQTFK